MLEFACQVISGIVLILLCIALLVLLVYWVGTRVSDDELRSVRDDLDKLRERILMGPVEGIREEGREYLHPQDKMRACPITIGYASKKTNKKGKK